MSLLIKNGRVITADADYMADIFIDGEKIKIIGDDLQMTADKQIDAIGKFVFPGGIAGLDPPIDGAGVYDCRARSD